MRYFTVIAFAVISGIEDIRSRSLSAVNLAVFSAVGIILNVISASNIYELMTATLPGIFMLFISIITGGCIGIGDGIFTLICALYLKRTELIFAAAAGWGLCAAAALMMISARAAGAKLKIVTGLPFTAFMLPAVLAAAIRAMAVM